MATVINFPSPLTGKATLIIPESAVGSDFENRLYHAMTALLDVFDVNVHRDGGFKNAANDDIVMFHIDVVDPTRPPFNWLDQAMEDSRCERNDVTSCTPVDTLQEMFAAIPFNPKPNDGSDQGA